MTTPDATPYDLIASWYDLEHDGFDDDLALYRGLAAGGGPALELACGSGRLLVPLAADGLAIDGVDRSGPMLDRCRARLAAEGPNAAARVTLFQQDLAALDLPRRDYRLAFIALGSLHHLATLADRRAALTAMRAHVDPGATLALDLDQESPRRFTALAELDALQHVGTRATPSGGLLTHTLAVARHAEPATFTLTHFYDVYAQGGPLTRTGVEDVFAAISRTEIALLLQATGWRPRRWYGDHQLGEWDDASPRLIVVAQAGE